MHLSCSLNTPILHGWRTGCIHYGWPCRTCGLFHKTSTACGCYRGGLTRFMDITDFPLRHSKLCFPFLSIVDAAVGSLIRCWLCVTYRLLYLHRKGSTCHLSCLTVFKGQLMIIKTLLPFSHVVGIYCAHKNIQVVTEHCSKQQECATKKRKEKWRRWQPRAAALNEWLSILTKSKHENTRQSVDMQSDFEWTQ